MKVRNQWLHRGQKAICTGSLIFWLFFVLRVSFQLHRAETIEGKLRRTTADPKEITNLLCIRLSMGRFWFASVSWPLCWLSVREFLSKLCAFEPSGHCRTENSIEFNKIYIKTSLLSKGCLQMVWNPGFRVYWCLTSVVYSYVCNTKVIMRKAQQTGVEFLFWELN